MDEVTSFIDYITGPERPPMTLRQQQSHHTHASLNPINWSKWPLTRHMVQDHGVWIPTGAVKDATAERHTKMHPEGEDTRYDFR